MAELIAGKQYMAFFRRWADHTTKNAARIRFQTELKLKSEKETDTTTTKDGSVNSIADGENSAEFTSLAYREDKGVVAAWKELRKWYKANDVVEFWLVDLGSKTKEGKYEVEYYQGYFKSFEINANADENVELSYEYTINGNGIEAQDTLTKEQLAAVEAAQYAYHTLAAETVPGA